MDGLTIGRFVLAVLVVLLAPGLALLAWLPAAPAGAARRGLLSYLADVVALSIAMPALLALGLFLVSVRVSGTVVTMLYGACLLTALAGWVRRAGVLPISRDRWKMPAPALRRWVAGLLALFFLAGLVAWRIYQASPLVLPNWVDSVQHFLIVRKMMEYGGLPPDLSPYLPVPFSYHYGFHLITAILFTFARGIPLDKAGLWFGQVLNALVALSVYRGAEAFAGRAGGDANLEDPQAGFSTRRWRVAAPWITPVFAALLVGFDFQMPAYYLTWGRYTMLTGLLLLGPTLAAALEVRDQPQRRSAWVRLVLLIAGQAVTHYFVLLLTGFFLLVIGVPIAARGFRDRLCWLALLRLVALVGLGIALASPWLYHMLQESHPLAQLRMVSPINQSEAEQKSTADYQNYLVYLIGPRRNHILLTLAGVGALAAFLRPVLRRIPWMHAAWIGPLQYPYLLIGWGALISLMALPWGLRLGPFRPDHYCLVLFFPAAILLADLLATGAALLGAYLRPWLSPAALGLAGIFFLAWGLRDARDMINSATVLVTQADKQALEWVKAQTPADARFYINGVIWQGLAYRGVDGGSWLLPYTGRFSLVPPIYYGWGSPEYFQQVNDWAKRSTEIKGCNPDFWSLVRDADLTYVYLRQGAGSLQPKMLATCPRLRKVYAQGGVFIYEILLPR